MYRLTRILAAGACALAPFSAAAEWLLKQSSERAVAGEPIEIGVVLTNDTNERMQTGIPARLPARLVLQDRFVNAELVAIKPEPSVQAPLAPGEFRRQLFRLVLPPDVEGPLAIELVGVPRATLTVIALRPQSVAGNAVAEAQPPAAVGPAAVSSGTGLRPADTIPEPALQTNEPMYFVVGRRHDDTTAKFQLSFKYRLFDERGWLASRAPALSKLYFAYTQTSLWNLSEESAPFDDTSYRPSLFYLEPNVWSSADGSNTIAFAGGLEHESNGRSGTESRSINTAFIRPSWRKFLDSNWYVSVAPKMWAYLDKEDNPDIQRYRGYVDLNLRLGRVDGWLFSADYRPGTSTMGAVQLDVSYPIKTPFFANAGGYIHFQYFNGYGESLLDYNVKGPAQYRIGFSIVR